MNKFSIFVALLLAIILAVVLIWPILADPQSPGPSDATDQKPEPPPGSPSVIKHSHGDENLLLGDNAVRLSPAGPAAIVPLIRNGGFEEDSDWTASVMARTTAEAYSGSWSMGSYAAMDGSFYQSVSFPSDVISATLDYYWKNDPPDTSSDGCYDYQYTEIWDETLSTLIATGPGYCATDTGWHSLPQPLDFSPIITDVRGLTVNLKFLVDQENVVPHAIFYFDDVSLNASVPDEPPPPPSGGQMDVCVPAESPPFAYINQPWDWVEGAVTPGSQVNATLTRGGSDISTASSTADTAGWFSFDFQDSGIHVDILPGDDVALNGGGLNETITVVDIQGWIDVAGDSVGGIASGGAFDVWGDVCVRQPFNPWFESKEAYFDAAGRFDVDFSGVADIEYDYIAQVVYPDPNGNYVVQVFYPDGLDLSVLISEDRVEGVTTPSSEVSVRVWDDQGEKGATLTTADDSGFFSTVILVDGQKLDIELGDHVGVSNPGHARETFVVLSHESWLKPWINRVEGKVQGIELLPAGNQGKVDLWSMAEEKWYSQYVWIESDGSYGADFDDLSEMTSADRIRLWVSDGDGIQQASFGSTLELGGSLGNSEVWGHTIADSTVSITLYRDLDTGGNPIDALGEGGARVGPTGDFTTTLMRNGLPVGVSPGNIIEAEVSFEYSLENIEFSKLFFIGKVYLTGDSENDILTIYGPANATVHVEGFRPETTTSESYYWTQEKLDADGQVELDLSSHDLNDDDIFQIIAYLSADGIAIESMMSLSLSPVAPSNLAATAISQSQIDLTWEDNANNEDGFELERSPDGSTGWEPITTLGANATSYSDTGLSSGTTYYYRVRTFNAVGNSFYSNTTSAMTLSLPVAPSNLAATAISQSQIDLTWEDNANNEDGFELERSPDGSTGWEPITTLGANATSYSDTGLSSGTTYYYRVRTFNAVGNSFYSNTTSAMTLSLPVAPSNLAATVISQSQIDLTWEDNANKEDGFELERSPDGSTGWEPITTLGANATSYSDTGLSSGTTYYYRVRTFNAVGNSFYSNTTSAMTLSLMGGQEIFLPVIIR